MRILANTCNEEREIIGTSYYFKKDSGAYSLMKKNSENIFLKVIKEFCIFEHYKKVYVICITQYESVVYLITRGRLQKIVSFTVNNTQNWYINLNFNGNLISFNSALEISYDIFRCIHTVYFNDEYKDENVIIDVGNTSIFNYICVEVCGNFWKYKSECKKGN